MKSKKRKKIILLAGFCLLLVATGVLNIILNKNITTEEPVNSDSVAVGNFFTNYRTDRTNTRNEEIICNKQMKWYEQMFNGTMLVRSHAGYIVNLYHFQKIDNDMIVLMDGTRIPVSRSQKQKVFSLIEGVFGEENEKD